MNRYFEDEAFLNYLSYLQYWKKMPYVKYISYPHALAFLDMLQDEDFRKLLHREDFMNCIHSQQYYHWQHYLNNRLHVKSNPSES